jgi:hypothetical protein
MKRVKILISAVLLITVSTFFFSKLNAASLTNFTVVPTSQNESSATNITLTFTPASAITNGTILSISYDTLFTGGAALTNTDIAISGGNITGKNCSGFVNGYFVCTLNVSSSFTSAVTVIIGSSNQLTTPSAEGNYSFSAAVDIGGLGTTVDSGAGLAYISSEDVKENEVQITAYVPPNLSLEIYQAGTNTKLSNPNSCGLGVLTINAVKTCLYDIGIGTNNQNGASLSINSDGALRNGAVNFTNTLGSINAGIEAYGFYISTPGSRFVALSNYDNAYNAVPTTEVSIASSTQTSDLLTTAQHLTITHAAAISSTTQVGNYAHKVTYRAYTN